MIMTRIDDEDSSSVDICIDLQTLRQAVPIKKQ